MFQKKEENDDDDANDDNDDNDCCQLMAGEFERQLPYADKDAFCRDSESMKMMMACQRL